MAIVQITVIPLGTPGTSLAAYVREVVRLAREHAGVKVLVGPNGTTLEGDLDILWPLLRAMHEQPFRQGAQRVFTLVNVDDRRDRPATMADKLAAVDAGR